MKQVISAILFAILCHKVTSQYGGNRPERNSTLQKPQLYYLHVKSEIRFRYARTVVSSRIANPANVSQEVTFSAILPETAFISGFNIEVDGKVYEAYVKEKEEAKQEYTEAVRLGRTAAHVALSARDSNRFTVSVNVEPLKKVTFNLTYEELLSRKLGVYKHVVNLDPGQIVKDLSVVVNIEETTDIATLKVPALRISNEINDDPDSDSSNSLASIERPTPHSASVRFEPTPQEQKDLAKDGIKGQLIVEYDVERSSNPGEVLVNDGYFVHFFAPADLPPLRKHVTFVLDVSGSMSGRKVEQLRQAMTTILDDLNKDDLFSIVLFSDTAQVWDPALNETEMQRRLNSLQDYYSWGYPLREYKEVEPENHTLSTTVIATASPENLAKAKNFVGNLQALSSTNMYDALTKALEITELGRDLIRNLAEGNELQHQLPEPIIIFLTDGQPNRDKNMIVTNVTNFNSGKSSIFSLALGNDGDLGFLKKLSLRNSGFARKIYEASDTALQLRDFYREVASPLLANVTFRYDAEQGEPSLITKRTFRRLFFGSELVVAGRLGANNFTVLVNGSSSSGVTTYPFVPVVCPSPFYLQGIPEMDKTTSSVERMWAYLTIQQLLEEDEAKDHNNEGGEKNRNSTEKELALELALQYSFVTPLTSLIVVKPNETRSVGTKDASIPDGDDAAMWSFNAPQPMMGSRNLLASSGYGSMYLSSGYAPGAFIARPAAMSASYPGVQPLYSPTHSGAGAPGIRLPSVPGGQFGATGSLSGVGISGLAPRSGGPLPGAAPGVLTPVSLIPLNEVSWIPAGSTNITLTSRRFIGGTEELQLAGDELENIPAHACWSPAGMGQCRHLKYCALDVFANNMSLYNDYYCVIQDYIGSCCPNHIGNAASLHSAGAISRSGLVMVPLTNVTWFDSRSPNGSLSLPSGVGGKTEEMKVAEDDQLNVTHGTCITSRGLGFCRHLRYCALELFAGNQSLFYPDFFCRIPNNYLGVCCPLSVQW